MWYLQLFGGITLAVADKNSVRWATESASDGEVHRFRTQKYALLLAYLALHPDRTHRRDDLVFLFWGESENDTAGRVCLRTALSSLRRLLTADNPLAPADPFLAPDRETLRLHPHVLQTDAVLFERLLRRAQAPNRTPSERRAFLERARSLYSGPLLPNSEEPWVVGERERLAALYRRLIEPLATDPAPLPKYSESNTEPSGNLSVREIGAPEIHLPASPNRYFGRASERETLRQWLTDEDIRLVTLTGIGGIGKTRLALETARDLVPLRRFSRVAWVPLVACADPSLLPETVLAALLRTPGYEKEEQDESAMETLLALLREPAPAKTLLILDNLEHLLTSANGNQTIRFVQALLTSVPDLCLLATSRTRLMIAEEQELPLGGLSEEAASSFLIARARAAGRPDWGSAGDASREAVQTICKTLEAIPLAMELVAGWASVLSPRQMRERLDARLGLLLDSPLTTRRRGDGESPRHRSLRAALDWGIEELSPETRRFFWGLARYFRGGCTLPAAAAVLTGGDEDLALRPLILLRDRSLLQTTSEPDETVRYHLLEAVREWVMEQDAAALVDDAEAQRLHFRYYMNLAERECLRAGGHEAAIAFERLEADELNLLAAIEYGLLNAGSAALGIALERLSRLHWCWWVRGRQVWRLQVQRIVLEAYASRRKSLERDAPEEYASLLLTASPLLPPEETAAVLEKLLAFYEGAGRLADAAMVCEQQATRADREGDGDAVDVWMHRSLGLREAIGDIVGVGYTLANWAGSRSSRGDYEGAHVLLLRCREMALARGLAGAGDSAKIAIGLAHIAFHKRDIGEAETLAREAVTTFAERRETWNHADALKILGTVLLAREGCAEEAEAALRESQKRFTAAGDHGSAASITVMLPTEQ